MTILLKVVLLLWLSAVFSAGRASLYDDVPYVDEIKPREIFELVRDQTEGLFIVQFYNSSDPKHEMFVTNYSVAAKSMAGYAKAASIDINKHQLYTNLAMAITKTPVYMFFGYYKHMPDKKRLITVDDLHEATSKQLVRMFEERGVYRLIHNKYNMEMSSSDLDTAMMKSKKPWLIVFYKRDHPKTPGIATVWEELVTKFHERVQFGSVNNPLYKAMEIEDDEYPVIKFYGKGDKCRQRPQIFKGEQTVEKLTAYLDEKLLVGNTRVQRITDVFVLLPCAKKKFCIFAFFPASIEPERKALEVLSNECLKYGRHAWAWFWNIYDEQPDIEKVFDVSTNVGPYGTIVVLNVQAASFLKLSLENEVTDNIFENIVAAIKDDAGFDYDITSSELPDIKKIKTAATREEL